MFKAQITMLDSADKRREQLVTIFDFRMFHPSAGVGVRWGRRESQAKTIRRLSGDAQIDTMVRVSAVGDNATCLSTCSQPDESLQKNPSLRTPAGRIEEANGGAKRDTFSHGQLFSGRKREGANEESLLCTD